MRMASDLVHDLCLDQAPEDADIPGVRVDEERMEGIRAYLASCYMSASFVATWNRGSSLPYQEWTATCCDLVGEEDDQGTAPGHTLVWLVRLGHIVEETLSLAQRLGKSQLEHQHVLLIIKGLEAQFREWRARIPAEHRSQRKNGTGGKVLARGNVCQANNSSAQPHSDWSSPLRISC